MKKVFPVVLGVVVLVAAAVLCVKRVGGYDASDEEGVVITIKDKERVVNRDGEGSKYLIWTEEGETFENVDSLLFGKFNSSDLYGQLERGMKYRCKVFGFRIKLLSIYRNLISCEEAR